MATTGVQQYLYLLDEAFAGPDWDGLPAGGERSVRDIAGHVGSCKYMYENHAFGDGSLTWDHPLVEGEGVLAEPGSALEWLQDAQRRLRDSVSALDDEQLLVPRMTNWGERKETRWIVSAMIQHDLYHAGEINHIRSLLHHSDRWAYP